MRKVIATSSLSIVLLLTGSAVAQATGTPAPVAPTAAKPATAPAPTAAKPATAPAKKK